jgi:hypothetical protein
MAQILGSTRSSISALICLAKRFERAGEFECLAGEDDRASPAIREQCRRWTADDDGVSLELVIAVSESLSAAFARRTSKHE